MPEVIKKKIVLYLLIAIIASSLFYIANYSAFQDKYAIADDARQSIYWMYKFEDPELFKNDPLTDYAQFFNSQEIGFVAVYYLLMKILKDPLLIFKLLSVMGVVLSSIFIFKIGEKIKNERTGFWMTGLFIIFLPFMGTVNGFYKNIGMVLFIIFFYFYISRKFFGSIIMTFMISLFYAPMTLICLTLLSLSMLNFKNKPFYLIQDKKKIYLFILTILICLLTVGFTTLLSDKSQFGHLVTLKEMKPMPEFYNGGRAPILPTSITLAYGQTILPFILPELLLFRWPFLLNPGDYLWFYAYALGRIGIILIFGILLFRKVKTKIFSLPKEVWFLFLSGPILFLIAKIFFFYLYVPKRYISLTLPLFLIIFAALSLEKFLETMQTKKRRIIFVMMLVLFLLIFNFPMVWPSLKSSLDSSDCKENSKLLDFLTTLPKDTLLAGYPYDMDCVPIISKRKVYLNFELAHPLYSKYYELIKSRTNKLFYAYYAKDELAFKSFCEKEKVNYFVFNKAKFSSEYLSKKKFYTNPFNEYIIKLTENKTEFYFNNLSKQDIVFESDNFVVVKC
ncbi:MAG: hypothetical protein AB1668_04200 [Nanoarchaeota archaeon]